VSWAAVINTNERGVHGLDDRHCCPVTATVVYWIRPCKQHSLASQQYVICMMQHYSVTIRCHLISTAFSEHLNEHSAPEEEGTKTNKNKGRKDLDEDDAGAHQPDLGLRVRVRPLPPGRPRPRSCSRPPLRPLSMSPRPRSVPAQPARAPTDPPRSRVAGPPHYRSRHAALGTCVHSGEPQGTNVARGEGGRVEGRGRGAAWVGDPRDIVAGVGARRARSGSGRGLRGEVSAD
jgi:hypothetical protein